MSALDAYVSTRDFERAYAALKSSRRLPLSGITRDGCPKILAAILESWPDMATGLLEYLSDQMLFLTVLDGGTSGLTSRSAHRLGVPPDTLSRWRHGLLTTAAGDVAAHTVLVWLPPASLPAPVPGWTEEQAQDWETACIRLDAADEPAGVILARLGARRGDRRAMPSATGQQPTGAVQSSAVLTIDGQPVALAKEAFTRRFAESLAGG